MKNRPSHSLIREITTRTTARLYLLLTIATLNAACGTTDPSLSSAELTAAVQNAFSPIATGESPAAATATEQSQTEEPSDELTGTALPVLPSVEVPVEPTDSQNPDETVVSQASCTASESNMQQRTLQLINEARAKERFCGEEMFFATRSVVWNSLLADAARKHSTDMSSHNFFSHTGSDGSDASSRVTGAGYQWRTVGENIAAGRQTAAQTINDWLESPGHCRNIMNPSFTEVAVTCVEENSSDFRRYWTNVFAAPR